MKVFQFDVRSQTEGRIGKLIASIGQNVATFGFPKEIWARWVAAPDQIVASSFVATRGWTYWGNVTNVDPENRWRPTMKNMAPNITTLTDDELRAGGVDLILRYHCCDCGGTNVKQCTTRDLNDPELLLRIHPIANRCEECNNDDCRVELREI